MFRNPLWKEICLPTKLKQCRRKTRNKTRCDVVRFTLLFFPWLFFYPAQWCGDIGSDSDKEELEEFIPQKLDKDCWRIVANPRGIGKSRFVQEWAARRKEFNVKETKKIGPVLFTDLREVISDDHLTQSLVSTLDPLFMKTDFMKPLAFILNFGELLLAFCPCQ